jgi:hypothetical protein
MAVAGAAAGRIFDAQAASKLRTRGMSSPSSQITGSMPSWPWSCQRMGGVMMRSPGSMAHRTPSTVVKAPRPSTMSLSAAGVWWWLGAVSPGRMICSPAKRVAVAA